VPHNAECGRPTSPPTRCAGRAHRLPVHGGEAQSTRRSAVGAGRRLAGRLEGVHGAYPWATALRRSKVLALETDRGSGMTSRRRITGAAMALRLSGGEGGGPTTRGADMSSAEAPEPAHKDAKRVRQLDTDGVAETEARRDGGGLPEEDKRCWRRHNATVGVSSYRHKHCE
jgi:hypothetical protein